ncbi:FprA family A-type flavoprotein [uncultured Ilyobacter sp.]|uniref:FprA family A-type flavoprotein n=1 Tax=uncultured Ilyobacter sp. TaxID=544433 RepID=UPI0029F54876|nr:FprA family A-type flavoprotein [uncultured Ilyobacter sp.]
MHNLVNVTDNVYWIGANDRKTERFENYMPLPMGVAYNSYVINDEKTCVIDTVEFGVEGLFMEKLECVLDGKDLDYIVVNHMEPDHSGGLRDLMRKYPNAKVVGNSKTFPMIKSFFHDANEDNFYPVKEGDILDLGHHKLTFAMMPMVHWPESMATYDTTEKILFSNDAFGSFGALDGGIFDDEVNFDFYEDEMRRYYANIVGKYGMQVQNAIKKLGPLEIKYICPSHGIIWRSDINRVIKHYDYWSRLEPESEGVVIVYGTMYGNTAKQANAIARELSSQGIKEIKVYDASKTDHSFIISDIWKYKGLIIGSCSHNNALYPKVQPLLHKLQNYGLKNRYLGIFGNMMWSGGGVRGIQAFADALNGNEIVADAVEVRGNPTLEDYEKLENIAKAMAEKIKSHR